MLLRSSTTCGRSRAKRPADHARAPEPDDGGLHRGDGNRRGALRADHAEEESTCTKTTSSTAGTNVDEQPERPVGIHCVRAVSARNAAQDILRDRRRLSEARNQRSKLVEDPRRRTRDPRLIPALRSPPRVGCIIVPLFGVRRMSGFEAKPIWTSGSACRCEIGEPPMGTTSPSRAPVARQSSPCSGGVQQTRGGEKTPLFASHVKAESRSESRIPRD
jgi:hypothetical protein